MLLSMIQIATKTAISASNVLSLGNLCACFNFQTGSSTCELFHSCLTASSRRRGLGPFVPIHSSGHQGGDGWDQTVEEANFEKSARAYWSVNKLSRSLDWTLKIETKGLFYVRRNRQS